MVVARRQMKKTYMSPLPAMSDPEVFSPSATLLTFDPPIPLLRGPVPAGPDDDPSAGPFVLAFRDSMSWKSAFLATRSKIIEQCEAGARAGCSISVSNKCKPPWWKALFGAKSADLAERERCEEREMSSCLASAKDACISFAEQKCIPSFAGARIAAAPETTSLSCGATNYRGSALMASSFAV
ncbi:hypothetical protein HPP92_028279 [Vanilla planifolia]|uniref:Uncharacterized protein n=1 Tax=Vanilla planifolia TaxID=51239 RepID=A0A835U3K5_VANPL|nr:hypothetical protein HPP92_028279 [Vanilla planifolia]